LRRARWAALLLDGSDVIAWLRRLSDADPPAKAREIHRRFDP
jgi:hypothetical protein